MRKRPACARRARAYAVRPQRASLVLVALLAATIAPASGGATPDTLPPTAIVFERASSQDPGLEHLVVRDLATGEERVLAPFGTDDSGGAPIVGSSLAPDRRWILFASLAGLDERDIALESDVRIVWRVAADGSALERVSPSTPDLSLTGQPCRSDPDCPAAQRCHEEREVCYRPGEQLTLSNPVAAFEGDVTWYEVGAYDFAGGRISGGGWLGEQAAGDPIVRFHGAGAGCALVTNPAPAPVAGIVLAIHSLCADAEDEGIHAWDPRSGEHALVVASSMSGLEVALETPRWLPDGTGFTFVGRDRVETESGSWVGAGLYVYAVASGAFDRVIPPPAEGIDVRSAAIAPDAGSAVVCYATPRGTELWRVGLPYTGAADPVVLDGRSCSPSW